MMEIFLQQHKQWNAWVNIVNTLSSNFAVQDHFRWR